MSKYLVFLLMLVSLGSFSWATIDDIIGSDDSGGSGGYSCSYKDTGHEEHRGGHYSCGDCTSKHGACRERCYSYDYTCKAVGTRRDGTGKVFEGFGRREHRAKNRALSRCDDSNYRDCYISSCDENKNLESSSLCPKRRKRNGGSKKPRGPRRI